MQLNIEDEMIEQMIREQVKARVNQYFGELKKEDSFFMIDQIKNAIRACAQEEVESILNEGYVNKICYDLAKSNLKDQIVESFASRIVSAFDD